MNAPQPISIAAFLKRYSPHRRHTPREKLVPYVEWFFHDARTGVLRENGRIVAVALVRAVESVEQASREWYHIEGGNIVWIDDIVSRHRDGIAHLLGMAMQRFGPREAFAGHVFSRAGDLRMIPWETVQRIAKLP